MTRYRNIAIICFAIVAALCCWAILAEAATTSVTLQWDANTEPDLSGYKLYEGTLAAGPWALKQTLGKVATTVVPAVPDGPRCWVVTATDTFGNESGFSNSVCLQLDTTPPSVPRNFTSTSLVRVP
jgi:hypothetical protein